MERIDAGTPLYGVLARRRHVVLAVAAASIGVATFAFRFLALRDFANDHYMHLAWAQQLLRGEVPGRDFVDPGYPLTYALSTAVQSFWPGPLSEAVLTIALLSIAGAVTVLVVEAVTGSITAAVAAGTFCALMQPQLYNYPKFLVPAVSLWLLARHEASPSRGRLATVAVCTTLSFLFRHDLGLYVAAAIIVGLLAANWRSPRTALARTGWYAGIGLLSVLPYLVFVEWAQGLGEHVHDAVEFVAQEMSPFSTPWPDFEVFTTSTVTAWSQRNSAAALFYLARFLLPFALVVLVFRWRTQRPGAGPVMAAALVLLAAYDVMILRHPVFSRIRDLGVPMAVVGAWIGRDLLRASIGGWLGSGAARMAQATAFACVAGVAAAALGSVWNLTTAGTQIGETKVLQGLAQMRRRAGGVVESTRSWPWAGFWPVGEMPEVVRYLGYCTVPSDHLLVTWQAYEYYFFARRPFAAGHVLFRNFTSSRDQSLMLSRLQRQSVRVALINETQRHSFASDYPAVDAYLRDGYAPMTKYTERDGSEIVVALRKDLRATSRYGSEAWPCGFVR